MTDTIRPIPADGMGEVPEQVSPSLVDELRVPLTDWFDPGAAGRVEDQIIRSID
jgi:hypothetical protein